MENVSAKVKVCRKPSCIVFCVIVLQKSKASRASSRINLKNIKPPQNQNLRYMQFYEFEKFVKSCQKWKIKPFEIWVLAANVCFEIMFQSKILTDWFPFRLKFPHEQAC